jgi:hypothetical protein
MGCNSKPLQNLNGIDQDWNFQPRKMAIYWCSTCPHFEFNLIRGIAFMMITINKHYLKDLVYRAVKEK